jgi:iron-sulfur cluster assembly protein
MQFSSGRIVCFLLATLFAPRLALPADPPKKEAPKADTKPVVTLTEKAASEVKTIVKAQDIKAYWLRVGVKQAPDGKGFSYLLDITEDVPDPKKDLQSTSNGIRLVIDAKSAPYLQGTTVDFRNGDGGKGFVFKNPNAKKVAE